MKIYFDSEHGPQLVEISDEQLSIDPTNLDTDLCGIGKTMLQYGSLEARLRFQVDRAESHLKHVEAVADGVVRENNKAEGKKITEAQVKSLIPQFDEFKEALEKVQASRYNWNLARWVMNSLTAKKDCLLAMNYRDRALIRADGVK